ncbi:hypothetical protein BC829DRAFT_400280 [Chytridium lagenaria]|nr:hypothetical protein BC829DRAFT_400280 [Chytridium lagenaria]
MDNLVSAQRLLLKEGNGRRGLARVQASASSSSSSAAAATSIIGGEESAGTVGSAWPFVFECLRLSNPDAVILISSESSPSLPFQLKSAWHNNTGVPRTITVKKLSDACWSWSTSRAQTSQDAVTESLTSLLDSLKAQIGGTKAVLGDVNGSTMIILDSFGSLQAGFGNHQALIFMKGITKWVSENTKLRLIVVQHDDPLLQSPLMNTSDVHLLFNSTIRIVGKSSSKREAEAVECEVIQRKASGKLTRDTYVFTVKGERVMSAQNKASMETKAAPAPPPNPKDPLQDLTFNLNLTDEQKDARSQVNLPFGSKPDNSSIHFEAEDFDDEEFDPDDDLEF